MKFLKILLLIVISIVIISAIGLTIFIKTFNINKYRKPIIETLSKSLQRPVDIGDIGLTFSLQQGVALRIKTIVIEQKDIPDGLSLSVDSLLASLDLKRLILKRTIDIGSIVITAPHVRVDMSALNTNTKAKTALPAQNNSNMSETLSKSLPAIFIRSFRITDGEILFVAGPGSINQQDILLNNLLFEVSDFSLTQQFPFSLSVSAFDAPKALRINGLAQLNVKDLQIRLDDVLAETDVKNFNLYEIMRTFPDIVTAGIQRVRGTFSISIPQMIAGPSGIPVLSLQGFIKDGLIVADSIPQGLTHITLDSLWENNSLTVKTLSMNAGEGEIQLSLETDNLTLENPKSSGTLQINNLGIKQFIPKLKDDISLEGRAQGDLKFTFSGLTQPAIVSSLNADGTFKIDDAKITNFNLLRFVLSQINVVPGLAEKILASLPEKYHEQLSNNETILETVSVSPNIKNQTLYLPDILLATPIFTLTSKSQLSQTLILDFSGNLSMPQDISQSIVSDVSSLKGLFNNDQQIVFPLAHYNGPANAFRPLPDMTIIGKKLIVTEGKNQLKGLLKDALGIEEGTSQESQQPTENPNQTGQKDLIDSIFDSIF